MSTTTTSSGVPVHTIGTATRVRYWLADRFAKKGDTKGRAETLRFLVERYPSSRFAEAAKIDLAELGAAAAP